MSRENELLPLPEPEYGLTRSGECGLYPVSNPMTGNSYSQKHLFTEEQMREYALANLQAAKPADVLGSLPVVAYTDKSWLASPSGQFVTKPHRSFPMALTDHAQATEALAKKEAFWKRVVNVADAQTNQYIEKCKALEAKLAGVDGLVEALRGMVTAYCGSNLNDEGRKYKAYKAANAALATYEAARREK